MYIQPCSMKVDWREILHQMDVSTMFYNCRYCVFTLWRRHGWFKVKYGSFRCSYSSMECFITVITQNLLSVQHFISTLVVAFHLRPLHSTDRAGIQPSQHVQHGDTPRRKHGTSVDFMWRLHQSASEMPYIATAYLSIHAVE